MNTIVAAALANSLRKLAEKNRDELPIGRHTVNEMVTLKVQGTVNVSEDTEATPTASIPIKTALALFMRYSGVTGPMAMDLLVRAMSDALAMGKDTAENLAEVVDLDRAMATVTAKLAELPKVSKKGPVNVKVSVVDMTNTVNVGEALAAQAVNDWQRTA